MPRYAAVRQDYIPTDVDEAEFEVRVTAPESWSLGAMDSAMRRVEAEIRATRGVRLVLSAVGGAFLGRINDARMYVAIAPHDERTLSVTRLLTALREGRPLDAFRGNYTQRDVMQDVRARFTVKEPTGTTSPGDAAASLALKEQS